MDLGRLRSFPNCTWVQFKVCNDDWTTAFEDMCTQLFVAEFANNSVVTHANANNPGVEVDPVLESENVNGEKRRYISFQAKFFEKSINWNKIVESAEQTVKHYKGRLDHVYLFCNQIISKEGKGYRRTEEILRSSGISLQPISDKDILNLLPKHRNIAEYFFLKRDVA